MSKDLVKRAADEIQNIENRLDEVMLLIGSLENFADEAMKLGLAGELRRDAEKYRIRDIQAMVNKASLKLTNLHIDWTKVAIKHDIDLPQTRGGGTRP